MTQATPTLQGIDSKDGTPIAFERLGAGPPVVLVCGGSTDRTTRVVGMPDGVVAWAKTQPFWADQEKIAHTLAYDATVMGDYSLPRSAASVAGPTLVLAGTASFPFMRETANALARRIPGGQVRLLDDQEHNVAPTAIAPVLREFFA